MRRGRRGSGRSGRRRSGLELLVAALLSAPAVLLIQDLRDAPLNIPAVVTAGATISVLVVMRLVGILRDA